MLNGVSKHTSPVREKSKKKGYCEEMTKMIVRTNNGKVRARMRDEAPPLGDAITGDELGRRSQTLTVKRAPWVTISAALLSPVAAWLLGRLDRRRGRHRLRKNCHEHRLRDSERVTSAETIVLMNAGRLGIKTQSQEKGSASSVVTEIKPGMMSEDLRPLNSALLISRRLLNLMEIRAESAFRPDQADIELVYALSGSASNVPDTLHTLSSNAVVEEASENHIVSSVRGMIDHMKQERSNHIGLVIEVHTHPQSSCHPSEEDRRYFASAEQTIQKLVPDAEVLFGIHAVGSETPSKRQEPMKTAHNTIRWSSINKKHEIAFYTPETQACEVEIVDQDY